MAKKIAKRIATVAKMMAHLACGAVSMFGAYQPDEPEM